MSPYRELAESVRMTGKGSCPWLAAKGDKLELIGKGRSAYVFKILRSQKVLKVFFPDFTNIAAEEAGIYRDLEGLEFFPALYEAGSNYLVLDFIEGHTLFECLQQGIPVSEQNMKEVDQALNLARNKGLNPSDIHLRNIMVTQHGKIKIIDVARYRQTKHCTQWEDLKRAFYRFYKKPYFPKRLPIFILNMIAALYKKKWLPEF
ncbi:protein kinase family protein [Alteribacillus sp. JSM 102045]|uniref:protein kinase family protein n=1 Tax=Alteribacillus sp. JSM 102045 TaxID=1562101 RepID=UPI0035C143CD